MSVRLPDGFVALAAQSAPWAAFVDGLPRLLRDLVAEWQLVPDGEVAHGQCAVVVPVRTASGDPAALKVGWPHWEAEHEHLALQHWHGNGAVRLLRADPARSAMLLERLHTTDLTEVWDIEACEIVAGFYRRLHVPAPPQLRTLSSCVTEWTDRLAGLPNDAPLPHRLVDQAVVLGRGFAADPATDGRLIHGDLHYENVLAADREPWLVIDPKPMSGDPHYEVAPLLWNRWDELEGDVRGGVRRRFHATIDAAGLDEDRARDWIVVRMVHNAMWELEDRASGTEGDDDWLTRCVTIAKAVQD